MNTKTNVLSTFFLHYDYTVVTKYEVFGTELFSMQRTCFPNPFLVVKFLI